MPSSRIVLALALSIGAFIPGVAGAVMDGQNDGTRAPAAVADSSLFASVLQGPTWERDAGWCRHGGSWLRVGDFNGDSRDDMLCHDGFTGYKWIDYADGAGQFWGTDWERDAGWCYHYFAELRFGDFNGDGRDDMLCHDLRSGHNWIDYADAAGQFWGTDWEHGTGWCTHPRGRCSTWAISNGDGRDDMLCHDYNTGQKWIDYADGAGHFWGTDWERYAEWCNGAALLLGDFNADNRADFLCHYGGYKWIDYADGAGQFWGTDWERDAGWCSHLAQLRLGDFNGDGRDDMLCDDWVGTRLWIDFADASGQFLGTDYFRDDGWCSHYGASDYLGDFNGDARLPTSCATISSATSGSPTAVCDERAVQRLGSIEAGGRAMSRTPTGMRRHGITVNAISSGPAKGVTRPVIAAETVLAVLRYRKPVDVQLHGYL